MIKAFVFDYEVHLKSLGIDLDDWVVKENVACNLTLGAVGLRNRAGDPEQLQSGYHPALSEAEAGETSTVTQRKAEQQAHEWGELYTGLSDRYLTLLNICDNNN